MIDYLETYLSGDNTQKVKYVILFFVFFIALSQNTFKNIFGCNVKEYLNNIYLKHLICLLFLFLLIDLNINVAVDQHKQSSGLAYNPFFSLLYTLLIYVCVFLLLHSNRIYVFFISFILFFLILLERLKQYYSFNISDQEVLQEHLGMLFKINNVFVIIIILTIIIGTLSSLNVKSLMNTLSQHHRKCNL